MERATFTRRAAALGAAVLLAAGPVACTTTDRAVPGPTVTVTVTPGQSLLADLRREATQWTGVEAPTGVPAVFDQSSDLEWFLWPSSDGRFCWALHRSAKGWDMMACDRKLPTGDAPAARMVYGPMYLFASENWVTFLVAHRESISAVSGSDAATIRVLPVLGFGTAGEGDRLYAVVTSWGPATLQADVFRADGSTLREELRSPTVTGL